jgi:Leucine-rich repeat (LRR) protein
MPLPYSAPPPDLAVELSEVRADASALVDFFRQLNTPLPENFPKNAVLEIANALRELPDGTARGCLRPLSESQSQLAAVRSQHILHEDLGSVDQNENSPSPLRGEPIDQRLRNLMSSVSTALQTANRLAAEEWEPESPEAGTSPPSDDSTNSLVRQSVETQKELEHERREFDALRKEGSSQADTLRRRLTDALILNWLGRGELRMPQIVAARLRRIASTLRDYPNLLEQSAQLISTGIDVAEYAFDKWHLLKARMFKAGTQTIREIADDFASYSKRLETRRHEGPAVAQLPQPPEDFDIFRATEMIHAGKAPPEAWRPFIDHLPLGTRKLGSLAPLSGLTKLRSVTRVRVRVRDISALSSLNSLETLNLDSTQVDNLKALFGLTSLRSLSIDDTRIIDLTPLSGLFSLESLSLMRTGVNDIRALTYLSSLQSLYLNGTEISDITPLAGLTSLQTLFLGNTGITDVKALSHLVSLRTLRLDATKITGIEPLVGLTSLESLALRNTRVSYIKPLSNMVSLESLDLENTGVNDLRPLSALTSLHWLNLRGTSVSDLQPLLPLTSLRWLIVDKSKVREIPKGLQRGSLRILKN